jgi:hypothetical protein
MDNGYAVSLNLAIWVGEELERYIAGAGWDLPDYQGNQAWMLPIPATFVVIQPAMLKSLSNRGAQPLVLLLGISGFACGHKLGQDKAAVDGRHWLALDH